MSNDLNDQIALRDIKVNEVSAQLRQLQAWKEENVGEFQNLKRKYPKSKAKLKML